MAENNIAGKRKKKKVKCPNPYFIRWLDEWRKEAAERGLKSQYTYQKAQRALQKFPVRLESGKACKVLEGFGEKICSLLDEKLAEHLAEGGTLSTDSDSDVEEAEAPRKKKYASNKEQKREQATGDGEGRRYIPQYRSGAYALILTLYRNTQKGQGEMKKQELMREAQPLADKDFLRPDPGCRYTSWSSMGTLIRKGYIIKKSNPAKYTLTESGHTLAAQIENAGNGGNTCNDDALGFRLGIEPPMPAMDGHPPQDNPARDPLHRTQRASSSCHSAVHAVSSSSDDDAATPIPDTLANRLQFSYISESGRAVMLKDEAVVKIDDSNFVGFLVCAKYEELLMAGLQYEIDTSRSSNGEEVFAYLHNDDAPERSTKLAARQKPTPNAEGTKIRKEIERFPSGDQNRPAAASVKSTGGTAPLMKQPDAPALPSMEFPPLPVKQFSSSSNYPPSLSSDSQSQSSLLEWAEPICTLLPGTFDIVLCVDNREVFGSGTTGKEALMKELQKNKVLMDVRVLQVGDFLWIARRRGGGREELVLNYVVERKRMDDLASSITDGRFREQKFRMKNCQLQKPIYLVEDYGSTQHFSIPEDTLRQAIINTQITEEFYVKRSRDIKESAAYLTIMTRYLQSTYTRKCLHGCLAKHLPKVSALLDDAEIRLMTFEEYDKTTVKSRPLRVREMFGKQLCQIAGMTPEKALAITLSYPTPAKLIKAYESCINQKERDQLLTNIKFGPTKRGIGPQMSKTIAMLYSIKDIR